MSVIAAHYYNEGKRIREIAINERVQLDKSRSGFCWIALHAYSTPKPPHISVQTLPAIPAETGHPLHPKPYHPFQSKVGHPFQSKPAVQAG